MRSVLITGASGGIGNACAELFAQNGYNVMMCYNTNEKAANDARERLVSQGYNVVTCRLDVRSEDDARRAVALCEYKFGGLDVLVNNAGISQIKVLSDITSEDWDKMFDVNVKGAFNVTKAALPVLRAHGGSIVNVSSMWGISGASCEVHYSASKASLIGFTKALAKEEAPNFVRVNCVAPGFILTEMNAFLSPDTVAEIIEKTPLGRSGIGLDVAHAVLFLSSYQASFITGQTLCVDGGYTI